MFILFLFNLTGYGNYPSIKYLIDIGKYSIPARSHILSILNVTIYQEVSL